MWFLGTPNEKNVTFFKINITCGGSPEDTVKVYAPGSGFPYNKVKVYAPIGGILRDGL